MSEELTKVGVINNKRSSPARRWDRAVEELRQARAKFEDAVARHTKARAELLRAMNNGIEALSMREQQVLSFVQEGCLNKEIADRLHITERTVKFHVSSLLKKYSVTSRKSL